MSHQVEFRDLTERQLSWLLDYADALRLESAECMPEPISASEMREVWRAVGNEIAPHRARRVVIRCQREAMDRDAEAAGPLGGYADREQSEGER